MSIKLTDTQLVMLSAAAQREDRCLVAPPTLKRGAAQKVGKKLISAGLAKETNAKRNDPIWRCDEEPGVSYALKLTAAGAKAIGIDEEIEPQNARSEEGALENCDQAAVSSKVQARDLPQPMEPVPAGPSAPRGGSKLAQVIELLQRDHGATIDELIAAMGWLAHTTRAALTGFGKRGYVLQSIGQTMSGDRSIASLLRATVTISFARHQFPPAIIRHAVWLYVRFTLSYRDVEDWREIIQGSDGGTERTTRPMRRAAQAVLIEALRKAHCWLDANSR